MERKCKSCSGKGALIDTTYDRTGAIVECEKCYGTGFSQDVIRKMLEPQREEAAKQRLIQTTFAR